MRQKRQINVTQNDDKQRCPPALKHLIDMVNAGPSDKAFGNNLFWGAMDLADKREQFVEISAMLHAIARLSDAPLPAHVDVQAIFVIGHDGSIQSPVLKATRALQGIEAKRLRKCPVCERIFWAAQLNMVTCGSRCNKRMSC